MLAHGIKKPNIPLKWLSKVNFGYLDLPLIAVIIRKGNLISNKGGFELSPVFGHLGGSELVVKPTCQEVGLCFERRCVGTKQTSSRIA